MGTTLEDLIKKTEYCLQNIHLQNSTEFLQQLTSKSIFLSVFQNILYKYPFLSCHLLCNFILDGWEAISSPFEKDNLRTILVDFIAYLCERMDYTSDGEKRAILIKCVTAWNRIILQEMKTNRTMITIDDFWKIFGIYKYRMRFTWNLRMENEYSAKEVRYAILIALGLFPEEINKDHFSKSENISIKHQMHSISGNIIEYLLMYLSSIDPVLLSLPNYEIMIQLQKAALIALKKWIQFGVPLEILYNERFSHIVFSCLNRTQLLKETVNVILEAFQTYADKIHDAFILKCIEKVCSFKPKYLELLQKGGDYEQCLRIAQLAVGFGESQIRLIMEQKTNPICIELIHFICICAKHPSLSICTLTFDFWYSLQSRLTTPEDNARFKDVFSELLIILVDHCRFLSEDSYEDVEQFRVEAKDTFTEPFHVLFSDYFTVLYEKAFEESISKGDFSRIEAILFAICSISDIPNFSHLNDSFFKILRILPMIDYSQHPILRRTVSNLIQGYSTLLQDPVFFDYVVWSFNFLITGIFQINKSTSNFNPYELSIETAKSFRLFCENVPPIVSRNPEVVEALIRDTLVRIGELPIQILKEVFQGLCYICKTIEFSNPLTFNECFNKLFSFSAKNLNDIEKQKDKFSNTAQFEQALCNFIDLLSCIFKPFDGKFLHAKLITSIRDEWPYLISIQQGCSELVLAMESLSDLFINIFIALGIHNETENLICALLGLLMNLPKLPMMVKAVSFIINERLTEKVQQIFLSNFQQYTIQILQSISSKDMFELQSHSTMIKNLFILLIHSMANYPEILQNLRLIIESILNLGVASLAIADKDLINQIINWFEKFIENPFSKQYLSEFSGPLLTQASKLIFIDRSYCWKELSRIYSIYRQKHPIMLQSFILNVLYAEKFNFVPLEDKKQLVKELVHCTSNRSQYQIISNFHNELDTKFSPKAQL